MELYEKVTGMVILSINKLNQVKNSSYNKENIYGCQLKL